MPVDSIQVVAVELQAKREELRDLSAELLDLKRQARAKKGLILRRLEGIWAGAQPMGGQAMGGAIVQRSKSTNFPHSHTGAPFHANFPHSHASVAHTFQNSSQALRTSDKNPPRKRLLPLCARLREASKGWAARKRRRSSFSSGGGIPSEFFDSNPISFPISFPTAVRPIIPSRLSLLC